MEPLQRALGVMMVDEELFAARRLGFGLRLGEALPAPPREWAVDQLRSVPKIDFYDLDGTSIVDVPDAAKLLDYPQSCIKFGEQDAAETKLNKSQAGDHDFWKMYAEYWQIPEWGAVLATTLTAINGPSPVFERFFQFWCNHFTASTTTGHGKALIGAHIQAIRNAMTGSFEQMLSAAVINPATIYYLDAVYSAGPHSKAGKKFSLNENLGRELLELYSVSPAAGYTQADVIESALVLTGWALSSGPKYPKAGMYFKGAQPGLVFNPWSHEPGKRTVMGKTYKADDKRGSQIYALVEDLAAHPSTATFIAGKLARAFVADDPPDDTVGRIAAAFTDSKGDLVTVHTAVIDEALTTGTRFQKFARPSIWIQQSYRTFGSLPTLTAPSAEHLSDGMTALYRDLGEMPFGPPQPNGWPDTEADWLSQAMLDRRMRHASTVANGVRARDVRELKAYVDRLAGADSPLAKACADVPDSFDVGVMLLASPQFLRV